MLFNSIEFPIFLILIFSAYWIIPKHKFEWQNSAILFASYFFYGWWDWRFLVLILFSSATDFIIAKKLCQTNDQKRRTLLIWISLVLNLGLLVYFKYFNFFVDSFVDLMQQLGLNFHYQTLNIILPVGISFYTFQTLSYTLDVYRGDMEPTKKPINFFAYVSFFPQLVAGPIERASDLLPQFEKSRRFDTQLAADGLRQILWGLFKKVLIADNLSPIIEQIFSSSSSMEPIVLFLGVTFFSLQIYCDFSGYSDIAIGTARLFGFNLNQNFRFPFFAKNVTELWRRWHISFSNWLRDYLFIPLSIKFRMMGIKGIVLAMMITFILCGLWHGAKWTFIVFGFWQGVILTYEFLSTKKRMKIKKKMNPTLYNALSIILTFLFWKTSLILFRADDLPHAWDYFTNLISLDLFNFTTQDIFLEINKIDLLKISIFIPFMLIMEIFQKDKLHGFEIGHYKWYSKLILYSIIAISILLFVPIESADFIYFQF